ncbi:MAG TPA: phosphotransferase [Acidimicrobiales bacterium]
MSSLGFRDLRRVAGGRQCIAVYDARLDGQRAAVKVLDRVVDRRALEVRAGVVAGLVSATDLACAPLPVGGELVNDVPVGAGRVVHVVASRFAEGEPPDVDDPAHAARMGRELAELHGALAELAPVDLPALAAFPDIADLGTIADDVGLLADARSATCAPTGPAQLLHGDFGAHNVRFAGPETGVLDFDDCGYGPVEVELAGSLYFVLFDSVVGSRPLRYRRYREAFLGGYHDLARVRPDDDVLDALIVRRVLALASWLARPETAPPGVRSATAAWRATLARFVRTFFDVVTPRRWP